MDPVEMYHLNRDQYNQDLQELIHSASKEAAAVSAAAVTVEGTSSVSSASSPAPTTSTMDSSPTPSRDPRLRKRSAPTPPTASKKTKFTDPLDAERHASIPNGVVHPARLELLYQHEQDDADLSEAWNAIAPLEDRIGANSIEQCAKSSSDRSPPRSPKISGNTYSMDQITATRKGRSTKSTLQNAVRRQWDPRKDDLLYEDLVARRRKERLTNVDRYIPLIDNGAPAGLDTASLPRAIESASLKSTKQAKPFPFTRLPGRIQDRILSLLLVRETPIITIDFTWLRPFVNGHCQIPAATKTLPAGDASYTLPVEWVKLVKGVAIMEADCSKFKSASELRGNKTRKLRGPCRGLTTGLFRLSREVHRRAATVFYCENTFAFPWPTAAWMQLESFLATIGPTNVRRIRSISIHVPLWHRGIQEDYIEGAILDLTTPASRLGVVQLTGRDRLLSAIRSCVQALNKAGRLENLTLELEHGVNTDRWTGTYSNNRQLISTGDAEEHVTRKQEGIELLRKACRILPERPTLALHHPSSSTKIAPYHVSEFRARLPNVIQEADKYGWKVDQQLKGSRW